MYIIDPLGQPKSRPVGIIVFAHVVRPSPLFKSRKTKQQKTMFATGVTIDLAEWIINDTCIVINIFAKHMYMSTSQTIWKIPALRLLFKKITTIIKSYNMFSTYNESLQLDNCE